MLTRLDCSLTSQFLYSCFPFCCDIIFANETDLSNMLSSYRTGLKNVMDFDFEFVNMVSFQLWGYGEWIQRKKPGEWLGF